MSERLRPGQEFSFMLSFKAGSDGRTFEDIVLMDHTKCPPSDLGRFLVHLGTELLQGKVKIGELS